MAAKGIPVGAAVRSNATGKLGRTFRNADGNPRGHVFVQWDGERDRQTVRISEVTLVADCYDAAKAWELAELAELAGDTRVAPRPTEVLIRGETPDERLTMIAIQVDHTMHVVEAIGGLVLATLFAARDEKAPEPLVLPEPVLAAVGRLEAVLRGGS